MMSSAILLLLLGIFSSVTFAGSRAPRSAFETPISIYQPIPEPVPLSLPEATAFDSTRVHERLAFDETTPPTFTVEGNEIRGKFSVLDCGAGANDRYIVSETDWKLESQSPSVYSSTLRIFCVSTLEQNQITRYGSVSVQWNIVKHDRGHHVLHLAGRNWGSPAASGGTIEFDVVGNTPRETRVINVTYLKNP